mgnify:CR=1 FL=1
MRRNNTVSPLLWAALTLPVLYLAALLASGYEEGMTVFDLMGHFSGLLERPFAIRWTPHTPKFMLGALLIYGFSVVLYCSTRENRRPGEEHGSAKWGSPKLLDRKYRDKAPFQNTILTQNVRMGLNGKVHRRNLLQIVIGGSGADKVFLQAQSHAGELQFSGHGPQRGDDAGRGPAAHRKGLCYQGV